MTAWTTAFDEAVRRAAGLIDGGRAAEGRTVFRQLAVSAPENAVGWAALARWADAVGATAMAAAFVTRAIRASPTRAQSWNDLGNLRDALKAPGAASAFERAAVLRPDVADHWANLARRERLSDRLPASLAGYRRALRLAPGHADVSAGLGMTELAAGRSAVAEAALRWALASRPDQPDALNGMGSLRERAGRDDDARRWFDRGARVGGAEARLNLGLLDLRRGDLVRGWAGYAWRFASRGYVERVTAARPWRGEPVDGKRLVVWREQGVGDELLFSRALRAPTLGRASVTMECDKRLIPLFERSFPDIRFVSDAGNMEDADLHAPIGSVPVLSQAGLVDIAGWCRDATGWLRADAGRVAGWRKRLSALGPGVLVGISWRSGLMSWERAGAHTTLADWAPLATVPGVILIDLQYGDHGDEIAAFEAATGARLHRWSDLDLRDDLDGVAALVSALDLVVCTATAVGELAGALGVPVWRLGARDWTFLGAATRPWFPSMRAWTPSPGEALAAVPSRMARELRLSRVTTPPPPAERKSAPTVGAGPNGGAGFETALAHYRAGRWDRARAEAEAVAPTDPAFGRARHLTAVIANRQGRPADALADAIAAMASGYADDAAYAVVCVACLALAGIAVARGDRAAAESLWRRAAAARPSDRAALINMGQGANHRERFAEAAAWLRRALALDPTDAAAWTSLGSAIARDRGDAAAVIAHRVAIALDPGLVEAWAALGLRLDRAVVAGRGAAADRALAVYDRALILDPKSAIVHYDRGLLLLRLGDTRAGWPEHDWRFATPHFRGRGKRFPSALWRGGNLNGLRLLIWREQGVGDEILFSSCFPEVVARAREVIIQCDRRLAPLFARSFPRAVIRPDDGRPTPRHDVNAPAGSLPRWLRATIDRFPVMDAGWLVADPVRRRVWRTRLDALGDGPKIGIAWRSGVVDAGRRDAYLDVMDWAPVLASPGVHFVNVQYGDTVDERARVADGLGVRLAVWDDLDLKDDLDDLAALMAELDLVLSPAMSAGELAAAVGTPVWRVGDRDWTWLGGGVRPWFAAMRLWAPRPGEPLSRVPHRVAAEMRRTMEASARSRLDGGGSARTDPRRELAEADADHAAGRWDAAARAYRRLAAEFPDMAHAWTGLGASSAGAGMIDDAVGALTRALALAPANPAAWTTLGNALSSRGALDAAITCHHRAIAALPELLPAWDNLGAVLTRSGRDAEACAHHDHVLSTDPTFLPAWINRARALRHLGRGADATTSLRMALTLAPDDVDAICNLTRLIVGCRFRPLTDPWMDRAARLAPDSPVAAFNRGVALLEEGRLSEGWAGYDQRFLADENRTAVPEVGCPAWMGEPLDGRALLAWGAQGIGDQFMFASTLPDVIDWAGRVAIVVEPRLTSLFQRSFPEAMVGEDVADFALAADRHAPLCSLPRWTRRALSDFRGDVPWLRPDPDRVAVWRERLAALPSGLRVGLSWRSGRLRGDRVDEYTALSDWGPLFALPGLSIVNLMYDAGEEIAAAATLGSALHRWSDLDLRDDLEGLAALIANLDLVIAPATSVGELAGALGVPVWRFGKPGGWTTLGTAVRPWFPTMRVFTPRAGETVACLPARIARELAGVMTTRSEKST